MSEGLSPELLTLARRHTRGEASPRTHQASRARVLDRLGQRRSGTWTAIALAGLVTAGGGATFAAVKVRSVSVHTSDSSSTAAKSVPSVLEGGGPLSHPGESPPDDTEGLKLRASPGTATVFFDDKKLPANPAFLHFTPDHKVHRVRAEAPGYAPKTQLVAMDSPYVLVELKLAPLPISFGPITSSSSIIDADELGERLRGAYQSCYTTALSQTPTVTGHAVVMISIKDNGRPESAEVIEREGLTPELTSCLSKSATDLPFRVTSRGYVKIPVAFNAK